MNTHDIRCAFLNFFNQASNGLLHTTLPSASLIPFNDPTLLFTNAGMVPLKNYFLGIEKPPANRLVSIQRCVRAGGKHNDLAQVGHTARHHTFFEMLGNFSIGDYFKTEAITLAWTFLTEALNIPKDKLWVTVYEDDQEAADIWLQKIGIDSTRLSYCGKVSNFWMMGDIGPCGPCSEIFYDHGPSIPGGPPGSKDEDKGRFVEIWNLVFMQYNADATGQLLPLPRPSIDTGMGLERIAAIMQGVYDNYDIDIFQSLLKALSQIVSCADFKNPAMRIIVDHIRSTVFLIADGVYPSNEGRGYVLRRIMRRAIRQGYTLGVREPFFYRLVKPLANVMKDAYPELEAQRTSIEDIILQEEKLFSGTLATGMKVFEQTILNLTERVIPGDVVFYLYDTYGFPRDLTEDMAKDRGFRIDEVGFDRAMKKQQAQSKKSHLFTHRHLNVDTEMVTTFTGYDVLEESAKVLGLYCDDTSVNELKTNTSGIVILDRTPFYAEAGGQVGDSGLLTFSNGAFKVENTQKVGQVYLHWGKVIKGSLHLLNQVTARVDLKRRFIASNHTATHLLHQALRHFLGDAVVQKGSFVDARRLRFDFSFSRALTQEELINIEQWVNEKIRENILVEISWCDLQEAKKRGAIALFGEKYVDLVRLVDIKKCSLELCGGTHVRRTGDIGLFKIISESAIAAGIRRIEAVTAKEALLYVQSIDEQIKKISVQLKTDSNHLLSRVSQLLVDNQHMQKQALRLQQKNIGTLYKDLQTQIKDINGVAILVVKIDQIEKRLMRQLVDQFKEKLKLCCIVLASVHQNNVQFIVGVSKPLTKQLSAVEIMDHLMPQVNGKGGGRADLAQGGGANIKGLSPALNSVQKFIQGKVKRFCQKQ
jgi:alanyl-tRNA synthetase